MRFRIDPAGDDGIHLVDIANGGERVYIPYNEIDDLINMLEGTKIGRDIV